MKRFFAIFALTAVALTATACKKLPAVDSDTMPEAPTASTEAEASEEPIPVSVSLSMNGESGTITVLDEEDAEAQTIAVTQMEETGINGALYTDYSATEVEVVKGQSPYAIFFHANWCPTCHAWIKRIKKNLSEFPDGVTIFEANYDKETELKKEYGVTTQTTLVVFDADGNLVDIKTNPSVEETIALFQ